MKRVLVVNHWHDDNRGDSAISEVTLSIAASLCPDSGISLHTMGAGTSTETAGATRHLAARHPSVSFQPSLLPTVAAGAGPLAAIWWLLRLGVCCSPLLVGLVPRRLAPAAGAEAVFLVGGSNLFVSGRYRLLGLGRLFQLLAPAIAAQRRGVPTYALGHTIGPLKGRASRLLVSRVLSRCASISVRESASADLLASLGVSPERFEVAADLAFGIEPTETQVGQLLEAHGLEHQGFLALALRQHPYASRDATERLIGEVGGFAREAVARGWVARVAVISQGLGPTPIEDDRAIAGRLVAEVGDAAVAVAEDLPAAELAGLYGAARAVVAVRLHAAILAIAAGSPAFAISYFTNKTAGVMKMAGLEEMTCGFEEASTELLLEKAPRLFKDEGDRPIEQVAARMRMSALSLGKGLER